MEETGRKMGSRVNSSLELALRVIPPFKNARSSVMFLFRKLKSGNLR